jgi:hypothetical protein
LITGAYGHNAVSFIIGEVMVCGYSLAVCGLS